MRPLRAVLWLSILPVTAAAQAPQWSDLWRVTATTLTGPAALESGPTGIFWNAAAAGDLPGLAAGVSVVQTPDVVGLSSILAAVTRRIVPRLTVGGIAGRVAVQDLVRTTTSPASVPGDIPVYSQFVGVVAATHLAGFELGAVAELHDAALDAVRDGGLTTDIGVRWHLFHTITLGAATHFAAPTLQSEANTDYLAGAEWRFARATLWGAPAEFAARYGIAYRSPGGADQTFGAGMLLDGHFRLDWAWTRERSYGVGSWRSAIAVGFRTGRYTIAIARGSGLNDIGANYRIGLDAGVLP